MKTFRVIGPFNCYGVDPGGTVELDETDPLVQVNVTAGMIAVATGKFEKAPSTVMTCPICEEKLADESALAPHYAEKHAAFVVPAYKADPEMEEG